MAWKVRSVPIAWTVAPAMGAPVPLAVTLPSSVPIGPQEVRANWTAARARISPQPVDWFGTCPGPSPEHAPGTPLAMAADCWMMFSVATKSPRRHDPAWKIKAVKPVTCGADIEVPLQPPSYAVSLVFTEERILLPGAATCGLMVG